jgi:hypothetical protein
MVRCRGKGRCNHVLKKDRPVSRVATFCVPRIPKQPAVGNCENLWWMWYGSKNSIKLAGAWTFHLKVPYLLCRLLLCYYKLLDNNASVDDEMCGSFSPGERLEK